MPDDARTQIIITALEQSAWPRSTAALAAVTGLPASVATKALEKLADQGVIQRVRRGGYRMPPA